MKTFIRNDFIEMNTNQRLKSQIAGKKVTISLKSNGKGTVANFKLTKMIFFSIYKIITNNRIQLL